MNEISVYIEYLKNNPKKFLLDIENMPNEKLLQILITIYNSSELKTFDYLIFYVGQENVKFNIVQPYNKILSVLRDNQMYAFKYVCKNILAPILNYQINSNKDLIPITLINLSEYPEFLLNSLNFIKTENKLNDLLDQIKDKTELKNHLIQLLNLFDKDLSNFIIDYYRKTELNSNNNISIGNNYIPNDTNNKIPMGDNNLEKFDNNQNFINNIFENTSNNTNDIENVEFYLPKIKNFLNQDILFKLSKKKMDYLEFNNLESVIRGKYNKDIIFCDGIDLLNSKLLSNKEYEIKIENNEDQNIINLDSLFSLIIEYKYNKKENELFTNKYSIVMVVNNSIFKTLFGASSDEDINMSIKNDVIFISLGNGDEYKYLLLYIYLKIHNENDLLLSNKYLDYVNYNLKSFINSEVLDIKKLESENFKNVEFLIQLFNDEVSISN